MSEKKILSRERALDSSISLAEILGGALIAATSPAAGALALSATLARHAARFYFDRAKERAADLHAKLLAEASSADHDRIMSGRIESEDYFSILNAAILEDESAKMDCYATFLRNHLLGVVPSEYKLRLLKALRDLTQEELQTLRRGYIAATQDMMTAGGTAQQLHELLNPRGDVELAVLESLRRFGFLRVQKNGSYEPTRLAELAAKLYFAPDELTARSLGRPAWSGIRAALMSPYLSDHTSLLLHMQQTLASKTIKSDIVSSQPSVLQRIPFTTRTLFLVLDKRGMPKDHLAALSKLNGKVVIKIVLPETPKSPSPDPVPELQSVCLVQLLSKENLEEFAGVVDEILSAVSRPRPRD